MFRHVLAAAVAGLVLTGPATAQTNIPFTLDWRFEGPAAPYFMAQSLGYFAEEGLDVSIAPGQGSLDAIPKVATGAFPLGFADMSSLMRFLDQNPGAPVIGVMMLYDRPAFAIVGRRSLGVEEPADLEGRVLGAPPPDGAWAQFPIFAAETGIDVGAVTIEPVGFPTREPMLAEGRVAAVTGFSFTSFLNTLRLGVPEEDISVLLMSDYGLELYGNVIIVNTDFAAANPAAVTGFIRGVARGLEATVADPEAGIASLLGANPALDRDLELRRLELALRDNIMTDWVRENGVGNIDPERFARSIEQVRMTYEFQSEPDAALYFTDAFLPADGSLTIE